MTEYDLTSKLVLYYDKHMIIPILNWLDEKKFYSHNDIIQAKIDIVQQTKMLDYAAQEYITLHGSEPADLEQNKQSVYNELNQLTESIGELNNIINNSQLIDDTKANHQWTLEYLAREYNVSNENVKQLYALARATFDCGRYVNAAEMLSNLRSLIPSGPSREGTDMVAWDKIRFDCIWGILCCNILTNQLDSAMADWITLRDSIDQRSSNTVVLQQLHTQHRIVLAHWALFIFFNINDGMNKLLDYLLNDKMIAAICTYAPYLLRYIVAAAIYNRRRRNILSDLGRTIKQYRTVYTDPICDFVYNTVNEYDFDAASIALNKIETVAKHDFFLADAFTDSLVQGSRMLLFETYARIYKYMSIKAVSQRLNIQPTETESKLVEYIRSSKIDAKLDTENNVIVVATPYPTVYQNCIDKTKQIHWRTQSLTQQLHAKIGNAVRADDRD